MNEGKRTNYVVFELVLAVHAWWNKTCIISNETTIFAVYNDKEMCSYLFFPCFLMFQLHIYGTLSGFYVREL